MNLIFKSKVEHILKILLKNFFSIFTNGDMTFKTIRFHFISDLHINSINIISNDLGSNHTSDNFPGMNSDSHIKIIKINQYSDILYDFDHLESHHNQIISLSRYVSLVFVGAPQYNITISNRI